MKLSSAVVTRPWYYDRSAVSNSSIFQDEMAENQSDTVEFTFTVPSGRKAQISGVWMEILCTVGCTSVTPGDILRIALSLFPVAGGAARIARVAFHSASVAAGAQEIGVYGMGAVLLPGDKIECNAVFVGDAAGTGRVSPQISFVRTEFDA